MSFVYDNAGRLLRKQDQLGDTCTFNYDLAGRMTSRNYRTKANSPSGTIADTDSFTFNRAGHILTAVSGRYSNTVTYTHDLVGRKATEALTTRGQTYTIGTAYNPRGELVKYTYPDGSIQERSYHPTGALHQLKLDGSIVSTRSYDDGTRLIGETLGNGVTEARTYTSDNLLTSINYGGTGTAIGNLSYTWDANKNKTSETITGVMSGYGFTQAGTVYDNEDRLTGFARSATAGPAQLSQSWDLTSVGDWTSTTINGVSNTRTHGPTHELLTNKVGTAAAESVTTDVKGNMTLIRANLHQTGGTAPLSLSWDFDNRLQVGFIDGSRLSVFEYDALGRRIARSTNGLSTVFVHSDQQTLCDYVIGQGPSNALYRYVYASYIDEPVVRKQSGTSGTILYFHRNQQFSVYAITNSSGAVQERYAYAAYGQPTFLNTSGSQISNSQISIRYTYTGREWDQVLGLYYFRARYYNSNLGRFVGRDPIQYESGSNNLSQFMNGRVHCGVDPLGLDDSSGGDWTPSNSPWTWPFIEWYLRPNKPSRPKGCQHNCGPYSNPWSGERVRCGKNGKNECRTTTPAPPPPGGWKTDGCGSENAFSWLPVPDFWGAFSPACDKHDVCYATCGNSQNKCDNDLGADIIEYCKYPLRNGTIELADFERCERLGKGYQAAVTGFGSDAYEKGQDLGCTWGPCTFSYCNCKMSDPR